MGGEHKNKTKKQTKRPLFQDISNLFSQVYIRFVDSVHGADLYQESLLLGSEGTSETVLSKMPLKKPRNKKIDLL